MDKERFRFSLSPEETLFLWVCFLLSCETLVEGHSVIGSPRPIVASPGDDVVLPCRVEPPVDVVSFTVEWSRLDLNPGRVEYVHLYRDRDEVLNMKLSSYLKRTELFRDHLREGNISLKLFNVTLEDGGAYRCYIPKLRSRVRSSTVHLLVEPGSLQTGAPPQLTSLHTPDGRDETNITGGFPRSRLIPVGVFILFLMVLGVGVTGSLAQRFHSYALSALLRGLLVPDRDHCSSGSGSGLRFHLLQPDRLTL